VVVLKKTGNEAAAPKESKKPAELLRNAETAEQALSRLS